MGTDEVTQDFVLLGLDNHCHPMVIVMVLQADHQLGVDLYDVEVDSDNKNLSSASSFTLN